MSTVELDHEFVGPPDAPVLVLAGSLGSTRSMWDPQVAALRDRFRVLRYDHRGHGGSPVPTGPYTMEDLASDALALLDRLDVERAAFCGLSLGGMVGMWLGAHAPERLSALVLCCTSAHFSDPAQWQQRTETVRVDGTGAIADAVVARWFTPEWARAHPEQVDRAMAMVTDTPDEGYAGCCEAIGAWDGRDLLGRITLPTLVLAGANDPATPVTPHAETIASGIPRARLEVLDDAAHLATLQQPQRANALIAEHLAAAA
ncbi:MAG: 3-oxoadipate enol-lactonase [Pseudonocardiaceae bacterium]|nr:3-oxoadipate enol-lactonase [Pseudonocardiaceae bacterium]